MGPRVPMYVISPWSRGGWVCSEVFDHTSTIRFLEARFGVYEPNISAWHRAVAGDLVSCFDFDRPNAELPELPDMSSATGDPLVISGLPPVRLPELPRMPSQDPGLRYSRALPYRLEVYGRANLSHASRLELTFENAGSRAAVFHAYDRLHLERVPRRYTVEPGKSLSDVWSTVEDAGRYDLQIFGPNGFVRMFVGELPLQRARLALPEVQLARNVLRHDLELRAWNAGDTPCEIKVVGNAYRPDSVLSLWLPQGAAPRVLNWPVHASGFFYDFSVSCPTLPTWSRQFAGRLETGRHGVSDPALGGGGLVAC
jgi:phospholipase C